MTRRRERKTHLSETTAVPVIVLSRHEDHAEAVNRALRNSGLISMIAGLVLLYLVR